MKVAIITSSAPCGKGESFVISEVNALADIGVKVLLIPVFIRTDQNFSLDAKVNLIAKSHLAISVLIDFLSICIRQPITVIKTYVSTLSGSPVNTFKNTLVFPKAIWLSKIILDRNVQHIHAHWATTPATVAMIASRLSGVPWSMTTHRGDLVSNNLLDSKIISSVFTRFISKSGIKIAESICKSDIKHKSRLLHMGVTIPKVSPPKPKAKRTKVILCPANLNKVKGHAFLLDAIRKIKTHSGFELHLAGSGPLENELRKLVADWDIQHLVKFLGHIQHDDLLQMYKEGAVDMVVLPSLDLGNGVHEGIPVSLMEAMAYNVPVISTATGGIPELLDNGAGMLVPHSDAESLAGAITSLLENQSLRLAQSEIGKNKVMTTFNLSYVVNTLNDWFKQ